MARLALAPAAALLRACDGSCVFSLAPLTTAAPVAAGRRGAVISPVSFQSTPPGLGSSGLNVASVPASMYTRTQSYGVMSTRIYTTVGSYPSIAACGSAACTYGGAVKAMMTARNYNMTGAHASACNICATGVQRG